MSAAKQTNCPLSLGSILAAEKISEYLMLGMHHSTTQAKDRMADEILTAIFFQMVKSGVLSICSKNLADVQCGKHYAHYSIQSNK